MGARTPKNGSAKKNQNICTSIEVPRKTSTKTKAGQRSTRRRDSRASPAVKAVVTATMPPSTVTSAVVPRPCRKTDQ